jgi:hypothetical protein
MMFIEVYGVKFERFSVGAGISKIPENRRLIELTGARIRPNAMYPDKCEITLPNKTVILCAGTYDEIVERIISAQNANVVTRVTKDN